MKESIEESRPVFKFIASYYKPTEDDAYYKLCRTREVLRHGDVKKREISGSRET